MIRFIKKTTLLVVKNYLQIARRPWWLVIEILVPLLLFAVLGAMRFKYPPQHYTRGEKLYRAMGLPSAGLIPFAQTLVCDLDAASAPYTSDMPIFPDANVTKLYQVLGDNGLLDSANDDVCKSLRTLESGLSCTNNTLQQLILSGNVKFRTLLKDPDEFDNFLTNTLLINSSLANSILNATVNTQQLQSPLLASIISGVLGGGGVSGLTGQTVQVIVCSPQLLTQFISFANGVTAEQVSTVLCALNTTQFNELAAELRRQLLPGCSQVSQDLSVLSDLLVLRRVLELFPASSTGSQGDLLTTMHSFLCGRLPLRDSALFLLLERMLNGDFFQQNARQQNKTADVSYIAPKILYTPDNEYTRRIMSKANRTFASVEFVLKWTSQIRNCSEYFTTHYPPSSPAIQSTNNTILALLQLDSLTNNARSTLSQAADLFNPNRPNNIWQVVERAGSASQEIDELLKQFHWDVFTPIDREEDMEPLASNTTAQLERNITTIFAAIVFNDINTTHVSFAIRMNSSFTHVTNLLKEQIWTPGPEHQRWKRRYLDQGFIFIQDMVERALIEELAGHPVPTPGVYLHEMPYPCYRRDSFVLSLMVMFPLLMSLAWIVTVAMTVRRIVTEKEAGLKEMMKMMQVSRGHLWFSWFITTFIIMIFSAVILTGILKFSRVLVYSDGLLLFLYLLLYATTVILYCFLCSVFHSNANTAAAVAAVVYFLLYFAEIAVVLKGFSLPLTLFLCLIFPLPFALGNSFIVQLEVREIGQHFSNLLVSPIAGNSFNFALCCVMLVVDCILYSILIWYIEAVYPGKYGVSKPWYFPFLPSYWTKRCITKKDQEIELQGLMEEEEGVVCEDDPDHLTPGIQIQNLSKTYWTNCGRKLRALKGLKLNMYEGQITAFLGHNGAGKTTTMSLLTGLFEPSGGTALVNGHDVRRHMDTIRTSLGMCPQHNILFDLLTVSEHLMFYSLMKGLSYSQAKQQAPHWLDQVGMLPHRHKLAKQLSGGMKRKLSILLAFVGNSRTVILDEPTSGVDPYARKQIWEFLSKQRSERTIMLSTHHMDEAEALGDRIAIISQGSLLCCGSFEFLKHQYGRGHHLTIVLSEGMGQHNSPRMSFIKQVVPGVTLEEVRGKEEHYLLPVGQCRPSVMVELFEGLDQNMTDLMIQSYGLSACTMEEIFVRLTEQELATDKDHSSSNHNDQLSSNHDDNPSSNHDDQLSSNDNHPFSNHDDQLSSDHDCDHDLSNNQDNDQLLLNDDSDDNQQLLDSTSDQQLHDSTGAALKGVWLACYQYMALLVKRVHYSRRKPAAMLVQLLAPLVVILLCLSISHYNQSAPDPPDLVMQPSMFFAANQYNYMFLGGLNDSKSAAAASSLLRPCGLGAEILDNSTNPTSQCYHHRHADTCTGYPDYHRPSNSCWCDCSWSPPIEQPVCYNGTVTGSRVQDLMIQSNDSASAPQSEQAFQTLTSYLLSTKSSYYESRYGGVSFGSYKSEVSPSVDSAYAADINYSLPFFAVNEAAKVWYSFKAYHAMPVYLNVMNNAILRAHLPSGKDPSMYGIQTSSHPFSYTTLQRLKDSITVNFITVPLGVVFAMGMLAAGFTLYMIEGRSTGLFHLQLMAGLNRTVYWLALFSWDLVIFFLFTSVVMALFWAFQDLTFTTDVLGPTALLLLCYGIAITPWMYLLSKLFRSPNVAFVMLFCLNFFLALTLFIVDIIPIMIAAQSDDDDTNPQQLDIPILCIPVPSYPLFRGLLYFTLERPFEKLVAAEIFQPLPDPYDKIHQYLIALVCHGAAALIILIHTELIRLIRVIWFFLLPSLYRIFCRKYCTNPAHHIQSEDSEVNAEMTRVLETNAMDSNVPVLIKGLSKKYRSFNTKRICGRFCCYPEMRSHKAVNGLYLGLNRGECFGLLGLNGAGKTTTFRMLTGDTAPSSGDALVDGHSVSRLSSGSVGYCPQVDAVCGALTGRENLMLFSRLHGVPPRLMKTTVDQSLQALELSQYADKPVRTYSGGNRRRLSAAIAMLTCPPVVLLDEPTSGVDPRARQFLWHMVQGMQSKGETVILTTHSMAECEVLCTRLGIMVNGSLQCLGTPQQLKTRYGQGYLLKIRVGCADKQQIQQYVSQHFPGSELKECQCNYIIYQLPAGLPLARAFSVMEDGRRELDIEDYSLSQTTLDDVFIHFAKEQGDKDDDEPAAITSSDQIVMMNATLPDIVLHSTEQQHHTVTNL